MASSFTVRVPGKAMLAGEYSVLAGGPAVCAAVRRHLTCAARPGARFEISALGTSWSDGEAVPGELRFAHQALAVARAYLAGRGREPAPLSLTLRDDLRASDGRKLGLGGSACTSVAVVAALLHAEGHAIESDRRALFALAALAHGLAQGKPGSGVDVAASTHGGTIWTFRAEVAPLAAALRAGPRAFAAAVDRAQAPELVRLPDPPGLLLAFSGQSASTPALIERVETYASREPRGFAEFMAKSSAACDGLRRALAASELGAVFEALRECGAQLEALGERANVDIVTGEHRAIARAAREAGAAAKTSGAGGGDCAVALGAPEALARLAERLEASGILLVKDGIDPSGVQVVE